MSDHSPRSSHSTRTDTTAPHAGDHRVDVLGESSDRFGSLAPASTFAHQIVTPTLLAVMTGVSVPTCQEFHAAFFALLEQVGRCDGLVAAPPVFIGPDDDRIAAAEAWIMAHPGPQVEAMWDARGRGRRGASSAAAEIDTAITEHTLGLIEVTASNPLLTFGSYHALTQRLIDHIDRESPAHACEAVAALTDMALFLIGRAGRLFDALHIAGDADVRIEPVASTRLAGRSN